MIRIDRKKLGLSLLSIPLALVLMSGDFLTPPEATSISPLLTASVFGRIMLDGNASFVAAMENLTFVILFLLLFSNYLSEHFRCSAVYVFTRIRNRQRWCICRIVEIAVYAAIYVSLYLIVASAACCCRSTEPLTAGDLKIIATIFAFAMLLIILVTVLTNMIALRHGTAMGVIVTLLAICGLLFIAIYAPDTKWNQVINPLSCMDFATRDPQLQISALCSNTILVTTSIVAVTIMVSRFDVAMYDPELK